MLKNLRHEVFVNLGGSDEAVHLWWIVQRIDSRQNVGVRIWWFKALFRKQISAIDEHLRPSVHWHGGITAVYRNHAQCALGKCIAAQSFDGICCSIRVQNSCFGPWGSILKRMIDHVWQIARGKGRRCACAKVIFGHRNDLDSVTGSGGEISRHGFLTGKTFGLLLGSPEP